MSSRIAGLVRTTGEVLILTGPPGAGKSTVADALARASPFPAVHLHSDDFWGSIKQGLIPPYLSEAHAQNEVVIEALAYATRCYAQGGYFVVVDGVVGPWFLKRFREIVDVPMHYIVLRPDLETTLARAQERVNRLREAEPIQNLHRQFTELGNLEGHAIDTSGQSVEATLELIKAAVDSGAFRLNV